MSSADLEPGLLGLNATSSYAPPPVVAPSMATPSADGFSWTATPPPAPGHANSDPIEERPGEAPPLESSPGVELVGEEDDERGGGWLANAPPFLISSIVHMLVMIILGLWVFAPDVNDQIRVVLSTGDGEPDVQELDGLEPIEEPLEQLTTPSFEDLTLPDLNTLVDVSDHPLPEINAPGVGAKFKINRPDVSRMLRGRSAGMKQAYLQLYGGTEETEAAVFEGLRWLTRTQDRRSGLWKLSSVRNNRNEAAATAMALLAYLGAGETDRKGGFQKPVELGLRALLKMQSEDGKFSHGSASYNHAFYTHAICTIALCEMYGLTGDSKYLLPAERAVAYAIATQNSEGGWKYRPGKGADLSVTGWMLMAMQSARMAGLEVPEKTLDGIEKYLGKVERSAGDYYAYEARANAHTSPALDAVGLLSRQYYGAARDDPTLLRALDRMFDSHPLSYKSSNQSSGHDVYYWYYAAQVAHHVGGDRWKRWNDVMRVEVPKHQVTKQGRDKGSWDPESDRWGMIGRHYVTCLSIYMLEVYYRHLPLYSLDEK
jgi:hypothetical protein